MLLQKNNNASPGSKIEENSLDTVYTTKADVHQLYLTPNRKTGSSTPFFNTRLDADSSTFWLSLRPDCPPKFTPELVQAFRTFQSDFGIQYQTQTKRQSSLKQPEYMVFTSDIVDTFSLGGDLPFFYSLINSGNRTLLNEYARACVELVYQNYIAMDLPMTTIALVKGNAMGGGMEAALSANVLVAERQVKMGLPEVLFNMFPGMGAYQFLSRRLSPVAAEKMILSGRTYTAEELYELGVIDVLAEQGQGEQAVKDFILRHKRSGNAARALRSAIRVADPISKESLMSTVDIWVDTAMNLGEKDLAHMQYLIRAQQKKGF